MANNLPLVKAALTCERVLHEKDGVLSIIRVVDTFFLAPKPAVAENVVVGAPMTALISIVSGEVVGEGLVTVRVRRPNGIVSDLPEKMPVLLKGGHHSANVIVQFVVQDEPGAFGLYWLDVLWDDSLLTSIPFTLAQGPAPTPSAGKTD